MSGPRDDDQPDQPDQPDRPDRRTQSEGAGAPPPPGPAARPEAEREADATIRSISRLEESNEAWDATPAGSRDLAPDE